MFDLKAAAFGAAAEAARHRHQLHTYPELSGYETNTIQYIVEQLRYYGIDHTVIPNGGVLASIHGEQGGKTVLLRADCDALPIQESPFNAGGQPKNWVSKNPGAAHMCGHDAHAAMLLAAGQVLQEHRGEWKGTVLLLFERGEEGAQCIYYIMEYLQKHRISIDSCWANHVVADLPVGDIAIQGGETNAAVFEFEITIQGVGGHASRPDRAQNPIDCFTAIASDLRGYAMGNTSPFVPITHCISSVHAGTATNVIPGTLTFGGTCRFFQMEAGRSFEAYLRQTVEQCCQRYGCRAEYPRFQETYVSTVCSEPLAAFGRNVLGEWIGKEHIIPRGRAMGAESFGILSTYYPCVTAKLGIRNEERGCTGAVHTPEFDIDEGALGYGILMYIAYAVEFLRQMPVDSEFKPYSGTIEELFHTMNCEIPKPYDRQN